MLRTLFMGTPDFAVPSLIALTQCSHVVGVCTQPDRPSGRGLKLHPSAVKKKALELGLPLFEKLDKLNLDVIVVVAYGEILKKNILELPPLGCINVHASLLPRWRGAAPIAWALLSGDRETGVTTQRIVQKLDAGDILLQSKTAILPQDNVQTLHHRLSTMGATLLVETLQKLKAGSLAPQSQLESLVTYAPKLTKKMEGLDLSQTAESLERRVRALNPWPGTSIEVRGIKLKILDVSLKKDLLGFEGYLYEKAGMLLLGAKEGSLELKKIQWEGKKETGTEAFLNGLKGRGESLPIEINSPHS